MQLVPRKVLQQLVGSVVETDEEFSYIKLLFTECMSMYDKFIADGRELDKNHKLRGSESRENKYFDEYDYAYQQLFKKFLKPHKKAFKFVDRGSSRIAFEMSRGYCLKVATCAKGVAQNKQEVANSQNVYQCFPKIYGCDESSYGLILVECCCPIYISETFSDIKRSYGVDQLVHVVAALHDIVNICNCSVEAALSMLRKSVEENEYCEGREEDEYDNVNYDIRLAICKKISKDPSPAFKMLRDIIKFYADHGKNDDQMLLVDLEFDKNWGLAIRENTLVPIVIDSGYSDKVREDYYQD